MDALQDKRILVGVSGGIAAYKSPELVRRLREHGAAVRVAMTAGAQRFITPLTLQAVSGQPVHTELLDAAAESGLGHIELARWADAILIAPASANCLARLAHGLAEDLLGTVCLATDAPIAVAPAMNRLMWANSFTRDNLARLREHRIAVFGPDAGDQVCGETGPGRMLEPNDLVARCATLFGDELAGLKVLITAGPTWEALDPVRVLTNLSSGRMGYAVAAAAAGAGARVMLVSGPTQRATPRGVARCDVESARQMYDTVHQHIGGQDIFIAVAAVADYRPTEVAPQKIKKNTPTLHIELVRNPDILTSVGALARKPFIVGFAAETDNLIANARAKLTRKGADLIAANRVGTPDSGFSTARNALTLVDADGETDLGAGDKRDLARGLILQIARRFHARHTTQDSRSATG